ncbi:hypothetical protein KPL71_004168 [Citrus sinensis]|uniref:Uncharacterized protein n=1 Tax=Citrus sinensis TaxID=2711 RepID=A0ACB8N3K9_CITSI|nr:hypothetical protein KPL71_004168 [Citrus sinensis]
MLQQPNHQDTGASGQATATMEGDQPINAEEEVVTPVLGVGECRPIIVTLQLAEISHAYPEGKIEDVLVKVDKFIFPVDFIVLDFEADKEVPIILGRPFLAIGKTLINVQKKELTMRVNDQQVTFNVLVAMKNPDEAEDCNFLSVVDFVVADRVNRCCSNEVIKVAIFKSFEKEDVAVNQIDWMGERKAIGWTMLDIRGISPSICMHKILLEDCYNNSVEQQRRLNPIMKEVVKKEIIKWLDIGIIYPISDSSWVSPVQCVPKKGGITVISNEKNELIPTRTVTGLRVCMDYRKLNKTTRNDHFPFPFIDQILDRLVGKQHYYFLDGYSGHNQIAIAPENQEKTIFTCPYGTFAFRQMPFVTILLGQRKNKNFHSIYYANKTLTQDQINYTTIEKELLAVVFAFDKFIAYLVGTKVIVYTDHAAIKYLISKKDAKPRLIRWILLLQEFDLEIKDRKGTENQVADHLSRLEADASTLTKKDITETFPDEQLLVIQQAQMLQQSGSQWYADFANYLLCSDQVIRRCASEEEIPHILESCHAAAYEGHFGGHRTTAKVLQSGYYWPSIFKDAYEFAKYCDRTTYKTPLGMSPYQIVYGKACHLPLELEHKTYWALKQLNWDIHAATEQRKLQLCELDELRLFSYENARIYKEKTKHWHDKHIQHRKLIHSQQVLLRNTRLRLFPGKLKSRWSGPFKLLRIYPHGAVDLLNEKTGQEFKVNGHRVKHYMHSATDYLKEVLLLTESAL